MSRRAMSTHCEYQQLLSCTESENESSDKDSYEQSDDSDLIDFSDSASDSTKTDSTKSNSLSCDNSDLKAMPSSEWSSETNNNNEPTKISRTSRKHTKLKDLQAKFDKIEQDWHLSLLNLFRENHINGFHHQDNRPLHLFPYLYSVSFASNI